MAITFTEHVKTINDALYDLIRDEFTPVNVRNSPWFEYDKFGRNREYVRFHYVSDVQISRCSEGETREFIYDISLYMQSYRKDRDEFELLYANRMDRITQLLTYIPTYVSGSDYKWHDARITEREFIDLEIDDENMNNVIELRCQLILTRTAMWLAGYDYRSFYGDATYA